MKNYVLKHNFGYGGEIETEINKLELRHINDLRVYVKDILKVSLYAKINRNIIQFLTINSKVEYDIIEVKTI